MEKLTPRKDLEELSCNIELDDEVAEEDRVTIFKLLSTPRFAMAALSSSLGYFTNSFMEPILAKRLDDFDLKSL